MKAAWMPNGDIAGTILAEDAKASGHNKEQSSTLLTYQIFAYRIQREWDHIPYCREKPQFMRVRFLHESRQATQDTHTSEQTHSRCVIESLRTSSRLPASSLYVPEHERPASLEHHVLHSSPSPHQVDTRPPTTCTHGAMDSRLGPGDVQKGRAGVSEGERNNQPGSTLFFRVLLDSVALLMKVPPTTSHVAGTASVTMT